MEILSFEITGKMAHFRKYYANNTAFSFSIPPRTTLMGIVAAAMGWPRDSYYEKLSSDCVQFGVRVLTPLKKSFQRLNFLSIKSLGDMSKDGSSDFRGKGGRIQTPFEIITGLDLTKDDVSYQIFVKPNKSGEKVFQEIKQSFNNTSPVFNITLGSACFSASIKNIKVINSDHIKELDSSDFVWINSAVPSYLIENLEFDKNEFENYNFVEEDMMPGDFIEDNNREVKSMNRLLFSITPNPLRVKLKSSFYQLNYQHELINIQFMDS